MIRTDDQYDICNRLAANVQTEVNDDEIRDQMHDDIADLLWIINAVPEKTLTKVIGHFQALRVRSNA